MTTRQGIQVLPLFNALKGYLITDTDGAGFWGAFCTRTLTLLEEFKPRLALIH